jgi:glycosyltransferase involved in cell wall biosynthesis
MKVKIILSTFNRPDLLPIQIKSLQKNLKNDFEILILHDSRDNQYVKEFQEICNEFKLKFYHHVSYPGKDPSRYHGECIQWAYDTIVKQECVNDITLILDHDMFLLEEFDIINFLGDFDISGRHQSRESVEYIWPGLIMFKYNSIKDIKFDFYPGVYFGQMLDTGGGTCAILRTNGIKYRPIECEYPERYCNINLLGEENNLGFAFELHLNKKFLHFRNACGWHNNMQIVDDDHNKKKILQHILKDIT